MVDGRRLHQPVAFFPGPGGAERRKENKVDTARQRLERIDRLCA